MPFAPPVGSWPLGADGDERVRPLPPPPVIRADRINYRGQSFESMTRDRDPVDAATIEALWRVRGSGAAVVAVGTRFLDIEKIDDQADVALANEARAALARIVRRGDITIVTIRVDKGPDWAEVTVNYINNRAPREKERTVKKRVPEEVSY